MFIKNSVVLVHKKGNNQYEQYSRNIKDIS